MHRTRTFAISLAAVVVAAIAAAGCGSSGPPVGAPSPSSTPSAAKLVLAAAGGSASAPTASGPAIAIYPAPRLQYELRGSLADLGRRATVRRMQPHAVSAADRQRFAQALGMTGTAVRTADGWAVNDPAATLSFDFGNGRADVSYTWGTPGSTGGSTGSVGVAVPPTAVANGPMITAAPPVSSPVPTPAPTPGPTPTVATQPSQPAPPVDVPSAPDAQTLARALLDRLGVLSGAQWATDVDDSGGTAVACAAGLPCPSGPLVVSARTVTFTLVVDGTRVNGATWSVTVGEHRRVESLNGDWSTPVAIGDYPLRSTTAVFADLQAGRARQGSPEPMTALGSKASPDGTTTRVAPTIVDVTGVSAGITTWDASAGGTFAVDLVPTYRFHAHVGTGAAYDIEVLALDPGAVTFTNPAPTSTSVRNATGPAGSAPGTPPPPTNVAPAHASRP